MSKQHVPTTEKNYHETTLEATLRLNKSRWRSDACTVLANTLAIHGNDIRPQKTLLRYSTLARSKQHFSGWCVGHFIITTIDSFTDIL